MFKFTTRGDGDAADEIALASSSSLSLTFFCCKCDSIFNLSIDSNPTVIDIVIDGANVRYRDDFES